MDCQDFSGPLLLRMALNERNLSEIFFEQMFVLNERDINKLRPKNISLINPI